MVYPWKRVDAAFPQAQTIQLAKDLRNEAREGSFCDTIGCNAHF
jgi:hypothetical protein